MGFDLPHPNIVKDLPVESTAIHPTFRNAMCHFIYPKEAKPLFTNLSDGAYFSESAYIHPGDSWKQRYWGSNYAGLLEVKKKYDPENFFWCRHCVGSDLPRQPAASPTTVVV